MISEPINSDIMISSAMTLISKIEQQKKGTQAAPLTRGQVAAQEQVKILRQALAHGTTEQVPQTRGQVAAQEQVKILREVATASKGEPRTPQTRGEVAAQEQMRIIGRYIDKILDGYKKVAIPK